jgi:lipid A disaccharide synthetase
MIIAGEASGDMLAAELVQALRVKLAERLARPTADAQPLQTGLAPKFFGAGGPRLAAEGVELVFDLTQHSVIGLWEVIKNYGKFKRLFDQLLRLAIERQPDAIICVDFSGFNRRFAHAVKQHVRSHRGAFYNWNPKIIQYVSPQVWASRPGRADKMARDIELLLTIFPFERDWYAKRAPGLCVEFVGHPMIDRYANAECGVRSAESRGAKALECGDSLPMGVRYVSPQESAGKPAYVISAGTELPLPVRNERGEGYPIADTTAHLQAGRPSSPQPSPPSEGGEGEDYRTLNRYQIVHSTVPLVLLLPGSRAGELRHHLPVMLGALQIIQSTNPDLQALMVLPNADLARLARTFSFSAKCDIQVGGLAEALANATLALASTGTVTMECAYFGVPTVALYKTSWSTYQIGKRIVQVKYLAMPNLLAGEEIFPEFIQHAATPVHLAQAALDMLDNPVRREATRVRLAGVIKSLGRPGASRRAAAAIVNFT